MKRHLLEEIVGDVTHTIVSRLHTVKPRGDQIRYLDSLIETCVQHRNRVTEEIAAARKKRAHNKALAAKKAMLATTPTDEPAT